MNDEVMTMSYNQKYFEQPICKIESLYSNDSDAEIIQTLLIAHRNSTSSLAQGIGERTDLGRNNSSPKGSAPQIT